MPMKKELSLHLDIDVVQPYHTSDSQSDRPGQLTISRTDAGVTTSWSVRFWENTFRECAEELVSNLMDNILKDLK